MDEPAHVCVSRPHSGTALLVSFSARNFLQAANRATAEADIQMLGFSVIANRSFQVAVKLLLAWNM